MVNGVITKALVDIETSHNFVVTSEAMLLGLKYAKELEWMKAISFFSWTIREVPIHLGEYMGTVDLTVEPMDDYHMVLGMEFMSIVTHLFCSREQYHTDLDRVSVLYRAHQMEEGGSSKIFGSLVLKDIQEG
ncbi:hypothetical protein Nepgr_016590 [Nepenthes gracilis]|uniref:Uncharacterized protein n=1 Tax=Nepenthes gracilis TaxID=150966 RepID=A0AAD3SPZ9_NEPGR|nr:hypothetical protein Nepgr_016590 [Nepenthes gracilis]